MRQYQSESINELAAALAKAQAAFGHARKDQVNPFFTTKDKKAAYADMAAVIDASRPHLAANGLSVSQITDMDEAGGMFLVTQLAHASGQWMRSWYPVKPIKQDPQGFGSAVTYARRYAYCALTGVAAADEDDDGNGASGHDSGHPPRPTEYAGVFETRELLNTYLANGIKAIKAAETGEAVKDQKTLNLARWNAMKDSANPLDRAGYEQIVAAYNDAAGRFKAAKPATVESAKQSSLPPSVANDTIAV